MTVSWHRAIDNATSTVASPYTPASGTLVVADASTFGSPSTTYPIWVSLFRGRGSNATPLSILECTSISGNTLTISQAASGHTDVALIVGDTVSICPSAEYHKEVQDAVDAISYCITFVLGSGTPVTVGTDKTNHVVAIKSGTITKAYAVCKTSPLGAALLFDLKLNGSSIFSLFSTRIQIASGQTSGTQTVFQTAVVNAGDVFSIDVVGVGSSVAGQDVTVQLVISQH